MSTMQPPIPGARDWLLKLGRPEKKKAPSFNDIAKDFDPYMPQEDYDKIREQYFWDVVHPELPKSIARGEAFAEWRKQTERPSLLTPWEKPLVELGVLATGHTRSLLAPLVGLEELTAGKLAGTSVLKPIYEHLERQQLELNTLAAREGLPVATPELIGEFSGMALPFAAIEALTGPLAGMLLKNVKLSTRALNLAQRGAKGSLSFGTYEALAEEHGDRLTAGAYGLALGAGFELGLAGAGAVAGAAAKKAWSYGLDTASYLHSKGVKEAEKVVKDSLEGKPISPVADIALTEKLIVDSKAQAQRPYIFDQESKSTWVTDPKQELMSPQGNKIYLTITKGEEGQAATLLQDYISQGYIQGPLRFNPKSQSSVDAFLKQNAKEVEVPADHSVISTVRGKEAEVAKRLGGVEVGPGKIAVPKLDENLGSPPSSVELTKEAELHGRDKGEALTIKALIEELWKPTIPVKFKTSPTGALAQLQQLSTYEQLKPLLPEKYRLDITEVATKATEDYLPRLEALAKTQGYLTPKIISDYLKIIEPEAKRAFGEAPRAVQQARATKAAELYEEAAKKGIIDHNSGRIILGEAKPLETTSEPAWLKTQKEKMQAAGKPVVMPKRTPEEIAGLVEKAKQGIARGVVTEEAYYKETLDEMLNTGSLSRHEYDKLKQLGWPDEYVVMMPPGARADVVFDELYYTPEYFDPVTRKLFMPGEHKDFTLESLKELSKKYDYDPALVTEESLRQANVVGKEAIEEALKEQQIKATRLADEARGIPSEQVEKASIFAELERLKGEEDTRRMALRRTPEVEVSAMQGTAAPEEIVSSSREPGQNYIIRYEPGGQYAKEGPYQIYVERVLGEYSAPPSEGGIFVPSGKTNFEDIGGAKTLEKAKAIVQDIQFGKDREAFETKHLVRPEELIDPRTQRSTFFSKDLHGTKIQWEGDIETSTLRMASRAKLSAMSGEDIAQVYRRSSPRAEYEIYPEGTLGAGGEAEIIEGRPVIRLAEEHLRDPMLRKETLWHEAAHIDILPAREAFINPAIDKEVLEAGEQISKGLSRVFPEAYKGHSAESMLEEAYVHTASALRVGDNEWLAMMAKWDKDIPNVLKWAKEMSEALRTTSAGLDDSLYKRALQRRTADIIRRADNEGVMTHLREFVDQHGVPDLENGEIVYRLEGAERILGNSNKTYDFLDENEVAQQAISLTNRLETLGVRGVQLMPHRSRLSVNDGLPLPETPITYEDLGLASISAIYKPMMSQFAKMHDVINSKLVKLGGARVDLYPIAKAIDDGVLERTRHGDILGQKLHTELKGLGDKKNYDLTMYLTQQGPNRPKAAATLKMSLEDVARAERLEPIIKELDELLPGASEYLLGSKDRPAMLSTLRKFNYSPEIIWGKPKGLAAQKSAGYFEKAIRYDKSFDPKDEHLGRILHRLMTDGLDHHYIEKPLDRLKALARQKTSSGEFVLGSAKWPVDNYIRHLEGRPDISQRIMNDLVRVAESKLQENAKSLNKYLPSWAKIDETASTFPQATINKMLLLQYAAGLGVRPIVWVRDTFQSLLSLPVVGPKAFWEGTKEAMTHKGWKFAEENLALLGNRNAGDLWGEILREIPPGGSIAFDRVMEFASKMMVPHRTSNNIGRAITFNIEYKRALEAVKKYRRGEWTIAELTDPNNTALWFFDPAAQSRLLKMADIRTEAIEVGTLKYTGKPYTEHEVARKMALELVDLTQWPYRPGTQPALMQTGAGRVFGMYGQWPLNYADYLKRLGGKTFSSDRRVKGAALKGGAYWLAYNSAIMTGAQGLGTDMDKWFMFSGAGYGGSPAFDTVMNIWQAPEDSPEGRKARGDLLRTPLNFVPGSVAVRQWLRVIDEDKDVWNDKKGVPGPAFWRLLGAKPINELEKDRDIQEWLMEESGIKQGSPY